MVRALATSICVMLVAQSAVATPASQPAAVEDHQLLNQAIEMTFAKLMEPGPKQDGWDQGGVDLDRLLETSPGGSSGNYMLVVDKDGERSLTIIRPVNTATLIPKSWKHQLHAGSSAESTSAHTLTLAGVDGPFYLAGWERRRRVGDAFCSSGDIGGALYEDQASTASSELPREMIPTLFNAMVARIEKQQICWRYDRDGDTYKVSYYLEDGRTLPRLTEAGDRVSIVPAGSIEHLLAKPAEE